MAIHGNQHDAEYSKQARADLVTDRRQHRKLAAQLLTPKAIKGYSDVLDYESRIMIRSMYKESMEGVLPISPAHYTGRYVLK